MSFLKRVLMRFVLLIGLISSPQLWAAEAIPEGLEPREAIGGILMAGLVGGILGLSTLSFYENPQDNIRNISIGAGIGMIAAAIFMTYSVAEQAPRHQKTSMNEGWILLPDFEQQGAQLAFSLRF